MRQLRNLSSLFFHWPTSSLAVQIGRVARFAAWASITLIGGGILAFAQDLEIGGDLRISHMGFAGQTVEDGIGGHQAALAYNAIEEEYLVAWSGSDDLTVGREIYIRRVDAETGANLTGDLRISDTGWDGSLSREALKPDVAWDSQRNRYLVVWHADDGLVDDEFEIYGQLIDADGSEAGVQDFSITSTGPDGDPIHGAQEPDLLYDPVRDDYFLVWLADTAEYSAELQSRHISASFPIVIDFTPSIVSEMASTSRSSYPPAPDVVFNRIRNEYLVVWHANIVEENRAAAFAQRVRSSDLARVGVFDRMVSADDIQWRMALYPQVAHDPFEDHYLIVWGLTWVPWSGPFETEIWGQKRYGSTVGPIGEPIDQRLTHVGPPGDVWTGAIMPAIAFDTMSREYLVAFEGSQSGEGEFQIRAIFLDQEADQKWPASAAGRQLSEMDGSGSDYDGFGPAVVSAGGRLLVAWEGDNDTVGIGNGDQEFEIYAQRVSSPGAIFADGFESGGFCNNDWVEFPPQCVVTP